jgi:Aminoglycoside-2''-adenylyltransferase
MADDLGPWEPLSPAEVAGLFEPMPAPWWIAGGWAIELYLGRPVRSHADIDILLLRRDQHRVHEALPGWDIQAADPPGSLRPWPAGETLPVEVHDIWCREHPGRPWRLQFMLDTTDGEDWVSRRDARIRRPVASLGSRTEDGLPILVPEIQLFYKAKGMRPKDQADFDAALPHLDETARRWLDTALAMTAPEHPWRAALAD